MKRASFTELGQAYGLMQEAVNELSAAMTVVCATAVRHLVRCLVGVTSSWLQIPEQGKRPRMILLYAQS